MDTQPIDNLVAEKLEMIPEVIQVTLHRHDEQFTEAKEAFETGYIYEALDALSEAAITSGGVPPVALECFLTSKVDWNMVA